MSAEQTEVVGQHMAIQIFAELSAKSAATHTGSEASEDGAENCTDNDARWAGKSAESGPHLTAGECGVRASCSTADGANNGANRHGCFERGDFSRVTARALK